MTKEWNDRINGERPIVKEDIKTYQSIDSSKGFTQTDGQPCHNDCNETEALPHCAQELTQCISSNQKTEEKIQNRDALYHGYYKELGTSNVQQPSSLFFVKKEPKTILDLNYPFVLPGLGVRGSKCQCKKAWGIGIDGTKIGYIPLNCKRIECPECYLSWVKDKVFDVVFKIEAWSLLHGNERPASVTSERINAHQVSKAWNLTDYDMFHRRTYRHIKAVGGIGGVRFFHPYKVHKHIKKLLKKKGYGVPGNGYWKGIRDNALSFKNVEDYYYKVPHDHTLVFPSLLKEHRDNQFFLKKIAVLPDIKDVINFCFYLISHCGVLKDTENKDNHPIAFFGDLHRFKPEEHLTELQLKDITDRINNELHNEPDKEEEPNEDNFIPLRHFAQEEPYLESVIDETIKAFPDSLKPFWKEFLLEYNRISLDKRLKKADRCILVDSREVYDIVHNERVLIIPIPEGIELCTVVFKERVKL